MRVHHMREDVHIRFTGTGAHRRRGTRGPRWEPGTPARRTCPRRTARSAPGSVSPAPRGGAPRRALCVPGQCAAAEAAADGGVSSASRGRAGRRRALPHAHKSTIVYQYYMCSCYVYAIS